MPPETRVTWGTCRISNRVAWESVLYQVLQGTVSQIWGEEIVILNAKSWTFSASDRETDNLLGSLLSPPSPVRVPWLALCSQPRPLFLPQREHPGGTSVGLGFHPWKLGISDWVVLSIKHGLRQQTHEHTESRQLSRIKRTCFNLSV